MAAIVRGVPAITDENVKLAWGRAIQTARLAARRTQDDVAQATGIPQRAISRAEQGQGGLRYYLRIADELGVEIVVVPE